MLILIFLVSLCVCLLGQHRSCRHLPWAADGSKHARQREALVSGVLCVQQSIVDHSPITWSSAVPCFCEWVTLPFALGAGCIGSLLLSEELLLSKHSLFCEFKG